MKRFCFGALCASIFVLVLGLLPVSAGAAAVPAPGAPQNVSVVAGGNQITITWSAPITGAAPTVYQVSGNNVMDNCQSVPIQTPTCVLTLDASKPGSKLGQTFSYKVRAWNGSKAGPYSDTVKVLFGKPTIPTGVTATPANASALVSWSASTGSRWPVTGYTVTSSGGQTCSTATTSCTVNGLTNGTTYTFSVTATNSVGVTDPSTPTGALVAGAPNAPTGVSAVAGVQSASVSFTAPADNGSPITQYVVTAHDLTNPSDPSNGFQWSGGVSPINVPSLTAGHSYNFTVTATNARGQGPSSAPSNTVALATAPDAPTNLVATGGVLSASVTFTPPADGGSPISYYLITAHDLTNPSDPSNGSQWAGSGSPISKPSLTGGHTYNFTIAAVNGVGQGPDSAVSNSVTLANVPDAPTGLVATGGVLSASVTFTAPADNGSPISFYIVTAYDQTNPSDPSNGSQWAGSGSPITKPSLTAGHTYTFTISASNGIGQGPESAASNAVVVSS